MRKKEQEDHDTIWAPIDLENLNKAIAMAGDVGKGLSAVIGIPKIVYKYVPYDIFKYCLPDTGDGILRVTQPLALNDTMECHVDTPKMMRADGTPWEECLASSLTSTFPSSPPVTVNCIRLRSRRNNGDPKVGDIIREKLSNKWGVVSFTTDPLNKIMWGTYAGSSSGFVVGYSTELIKPLGAGINKVVYLPKPLQLLPVEGGCLLLGDLNRDRIFEASGRNLTKILFVKGREWSYEQEVRMAVPLEDTESTGKKDSMGHLIRVIRIPVSSIAEIYYGQNTPQEEVSRAKTILGTPGCSTTRLRTVESMPGSYEYHAKPG